MRKSDFTDLVLKNVRVEFWNKGDEKYKPSLVISADDPAVRAKISKWVEDNRVGEGKDAGKAVFSTYQPDGEEGETYFRYLFRVTDKTRIGGINNLTKSDLGRGSRVSIVVNAFQYASKFGTGVSKSVAAIKILTPANNSNDKAYDRLMNDTDDEDIELEDFDEVEEDATDEIKAEDIPEF